MVKLYFHIINKFTKMKVNNIENDKNIFSNIKLIETKLPIIDSSYISKYDYERIKKNAIFPSKEESFNEEIIRKEQENDKLAKGKALKEKILNYNLKIYNYT